MAQYNIISPVIRHVYGIAQHQSVEGASPLPQEMEVSGFGLQQMASVALFCKGTVGTCTVFRGVRMARSISFLDLLALD